MRHSIPRNSCFLFAFFHNGDQHLNERIGSFRYFFPLKLVGCFECNGPLGKYFSLYQAFQREGERKEKWKTREKMSEQPHPHLLRLPTRIKICRTPRHWKFTQHHRTTRPTPLYWGKRDSCFSISEDMFLLNYCFVSSNAIRNCHKKARVQTSYTSDALM